MSLGRCSRCAAKEAGEHRAGWHRPYRKGIVLDGEHVLLLRALAGRHPAACSLSCTVPLQTNRPAAAPSVVWGAAAVGVGHGTLLYADGPAVFSLSIFAYHP